MEVEGDSLAIPDREYDANITLPSGEFQKICRDLTIIGETVTIEASKEGVKFSVSGEMGNGNVCYFYQLLTNWDKKLTFFL